MTQVKIWTLGAANTNADKEINWGDALPNFADADILIINLRTLLSTKLATINKRDYSLTKDAILDKCTSGGKIIFITSPHFTIQETVSLPSFLGGSPSVRSYPHSNYDLSPFQINTTTVPEGEEIVYDKHGPVENPFLSYLTTVKKFSFYLTDFKNTPINSRGSSTSILSNFEVKDKSGHILGRVYEIAPGGGQVIFLPPPTSISISDAINKIIEKLRVETSSTAIDEPPNWTNDISIPTLEGKQMELSKLEISKKSLNEQIQKIENEIQKIRNHTRLLYANGPSLEDAVYDALRVLGFLEIKRIREKDKEDGIIEFQTTPGFKFGVIEIEGSCKRTSIEKLDQCHRWVNDHFLAGEEVKGIFISNQFRTQVYPASKSERINFEHNQLKYADTRKLCIIPSCILFEAVSKALAGDLRSRKDIEKSLVETNGVLTDL